MLFEEIKKFKEKLTNEAVYGPFSKTSDPGIIEAAGYGGFDFIILDLEHGPNNVQTLQNLIRAAQNSNILPIVRVKENCDSLIGEVLDVGAAGIQVPQISNAEDASRIIRLAKFAPQGMRGVCRFVRAANYSSMDRYEYFKKSNDALIIMHLEGQESINNLDEIMDVSGIDVLFIGPYDLSQSLGVPGQIDHPIVEEKMKQIIQKCKEKGIYVGTFVDTLENAKKWENAGVKYISYSVDIGIFYEQCKNIMQNLKGDSHEN
ncbi:MAG: aldolase [Desulfitibacter sp. BRH_c19]|nr:MAG: aldolase [Desulfitibacter sp. BRH_c19]